jgi:hypothetical protein
VLDFTVILELRKPFELIFVVVSLKQIQIRVEYFT